MKTVRTPAGETWQITKRPGQKRVRAKTSIGGRNFWELPAPKKLAWSAGMGIVATATVLATFAATVILAFRSPFLADVPILIFLAIFALRIVFWPWHVHATRRDAWMKEDTHRWIEQGWLAARRRGRQVEQDIAAGRGEFGGDPSAL